jgi:hypothetical protein
MGSFKQPQVFLPLDLEIMDRAMKLRGQSSKPAIHSETERRMVNAGRLSGSSSWIRRKRAKLISTPS